MLALIDESARAGHGPFHYVVAAAVIVADDMATRSALISAVAVGSRRNPFHWASEGPTMRTRLL